MSHTFANVSGAGMQYQPQSAQVIRNNDAFSTPLGYQQEQQVVGKDVNPFQIANRVSDFKDKINPEGFFKNPTKET